MKQHETHTAQQSPSDGIFVLTVTADPASYFNAHGTPCNGNSIHEYTVQLSSQNS